MAQLTLAPHRNSFVWVAPFISTILIVMTLFFIDEGYYDFRWMKDIGNWVVFGLYVIVIFPIQYVLAYLFFRKGGNWKGLFLYELIIVPACLLVIFWLVF